MKKNLYIDITNLYITRSMTGIQRVVRSLTPYFIKSSDFNVNVLFYDESRGVYCVFDNEDVLGLLDGSLSVGELLNPTRDMNVSEIKAPDIFFDIDSAWHVPHKRDGLYKEFKKNGATIVSYVYDLVPIKLPQYAHTDTVNNFTTYMHAVYKYADLVLTDSRSTERDFLDVQVQFKIKRHIPTVVTRLGADFKLDKTAKKRASKLLKDIIKHKYLLFVGTLEPRKNQSLLLESYRRIIQDHPDTYLVYVGKKGWNNEEFIKELIAECEKNPKVYWLQGLEDKDLNLLYMHSFLNIYISKYEGYGLPIVESLGYGKPTITSKNSSMYEAGLNFADYIEYETMDELSEQIDLYLRNPEIYKAKCRFIRKNYQPVRWQQVYFTINSSLKNINTVYNPELLAVRTATFQHVIISIRPDDVKRCIQRTDQMATFVKEYIVVTSPKLVKAIKRIKSVHKLIVIDEKELLGEKYRAFATSTHVQKNWLLRTSIVDSESIDEYFIMLDDDNLPLKKISQGNFITDGRMNAYYFSELLEWDKHLTSYDAGQQDMKDILLKHNLETLMYSSHRPQIISKTIFREAAKFFNHDADRYQLDEWSTYFNYAVTRYPSLFRKLPYTTLNWPAHPNDWTTRVIPTEYTHENYYEHIYHRDQVFSGLKITASINSKLHRKRRQLNPYTASSELQTSLRKKISEYSLVHGAAIFTHQDKEEVIVSSLPMLFAAVPDTYTSYKLNYKILNAKKGGTYKLIAQNNGGAVTSVVLPSKSKDDSDNYVEGVVDLPIHTALLGKFQINFSIATEDYEMQPVAQRYDAILLGVDSAEVDLEEVIKKENYVD